MQISTKPGYYQAMAKLRGRSDLMETSVINPFTERYVFLMSLWLIKTDIYCCQWEKKISKNNYLIFQDYIQNTSIAKII